MPNEVIDIDAMPSTVKTVLVTGAFGFVGTELLGHLTSAEYKVIAASRSPAKMHEGGESLQTVAVACISIGIRLKQFRVSQKVRFLRFSEECQ